MCSKQSLHLVGGVMIHARRPCGAPVSAPLVDTPSAPDETACQPKMKMSLAEANSQSLLPSQSVASHGVPVIKKQDECVR